VISGQVKRVARPAGDQPPFDAAAALERTEGSEELLREVAALFREETPRLLDEIRTAMATSDARAVQRVAHALKGSVSHFGAPRAGAAAAALEHAAREAAGPELRERARVLEVEVQLLQDALREWADGERPAEGA
jgi:HPt (histidine-containing phosphotransfer) domain-containing protein